MSSCSNYVIGIIVRHVDFSSLGNASPLLSVTSRKRDPTWVKRHYGYIQPVSRSCRILTFPAMWR